MLFVLTALAGIGAIYFWAIHIAAAAMSALLVLVICLIAAVLIKSKISK